MKIGIIGFGHLAQSFAKGLLKQKDMAEDIFIADIDKETKQRALVDYGIVSFPNNKDLVENTDLLILAVKPSQAQEVLDEIKDILKDKVLVSFLAGTKIQAIEDALDGQGQVIRVMPSIAMEVSESLSAICPGTHATEDSTLIVKDLFSHLGRALISNEEDLERISVISGSGLGYAAHILGAMAQGAKAIGYEKDNEADLVQVFLGASKLLAESGIAASQMAKAVATEGGTTIEGIRVLDQADLASVFAKTMEASYKKVKDLQN